MKTIDVGDLPEPVGKAIEHVVQTLREQLQFHASAEPRRKVTLHERRGRVLGQLTREEIYENAG